MQRPSIAIPLAESSILAYRLAPTLKDRIVLHLLDCGFYDIDLVRPARAKYEGVEYVLEDFNGR